MSKYKKKNKDAFKDTLSLIKYKAAKAAFMKCKCPTKDDLSNCKTREEADALLDQYFVKEFVDDYKKYAKYLKEDFSSYKIDNLK